MVARQKEVLTSVLMVSAAALRKSVSYREDPSFLRFGASLFESNDTRGLCNRAGSREGLEGGCSEG